MQGTREETEVLMCCFGKIHGRIEVAYVNVCFSRSWCCRVMFTWSEEQLEVEEFHVK